MPDIVFHPPEAQKYWGHFIPPAPYIHLGIHSARLYLVLAQETGDEDVGVVGLCPAAALSELCGGGGGVGDGIGTPRGSEGAGDRGEAGASELPRGAEPGEGLATEDSLDFVPFWPCFADWSLGQIADLF